MLIDRINSTTEVFDVAAVQTFHGMSEAFIHNFPLRTVTEKMRNQALEVELH